MTHETLTDVPQALQTRFLLLLAQPFPTHSVRYGRGLGSGGSMHRSTLDWRFPWFRCARMTFYRIGHVVASCHGYSYQSGSCPSSCRLLTMKTLPLLFLGRKFPQIELQLNNIHLNRMPNRRQWDINLNRTMLRNEALLSPRKNPLPHNK